MNRASHSHPSIEIIERPAGRTIAHVLFDFDGTLSLIREGWPSVMLPVFLEAWTPLKHGLSQPELRKLALDDIVELTGKETIYQMIRLAERVEQFGGAARDPLDYKNEYLHRLMDHIAHRRQSLADGSRKPDELLLPGSRALLEALTARHCTLYLASGTDRPYVLDEARLVDVDRYFGPYIYGARPDDRKGENLKRAVIERLLRENNVDGRALLGFGDGFVEIEEVTRAGGYAIGVASDEKAGGGRIEPWKRERLLAAGAKAIIADFSDLTALLELCFD